MGAGDFIIKVKSVNNTIKCQKCGDITSPHGYNRSIRLRHLPVFGRKTYIEISPARSICNNIKVLYIASYKIITCCVTINADVNLRLITSLNCIKTIYEGEVSIQKDK